MERLRQQAAAKPSIKSVIESLTIERESAGQVVLAANDQETLSAARAMKSTLDDLLSKAAGRTLRSELKLADGAGPQVVVREVGFDAAAHHEAMSNPLVRKAVELFDARLIDVQPDHE